MIFGQSFRAQNLSLPEGLSQSQVSSICEDDRGAIWLGTKGGGVNQFDGRSFSTFTTDNGLLGNDVGAIAKDLKGNLWFACNQAGLCYYDGYRFRSFEYNQLAPFNTATDLYVSSKGHIWLATLGQGVYHWDGLRMENFKSSNSILSDSVTRILQIDENEIWLGSLRGIVQYKDHHLHTLSDAGYSQSPKRYVGALRKMADGSTWGGENGQYWYLKGKTFMYDSLPESIMTITDILKDASGNIWLTGDYLGARFTTTGFHRLGVEDGLKESKTTCLLEDRAGNVWMGSDGGGAIRYSREAFTWYGEDTEIDNRGIFSIAELAEDYLMVGTERGLFQIKDGIVSEFPDFPKPESYVLSLMQLPAGKILIATTDGSYSWDGKQFQRYVVKEPIQNFSIFTKNAQGKILGTTRQGCYEIADDSIRKLDLSGLNFDGRYSGYQDHANRLWFISITSGVVRLTNGEAKYYSAPRDLPTDYIMNLVEGPHDAIWVGTTDGLVRINDSSTCYLSKREGLSGNLIYTLLVDDQGDLWAGTENGLSRITLNQNSDPIAVQTFGPAEGFTGIECNQNATLKDSQGRLWFGTIEGLCSYQPALDIKDTRPPHVEISDFRINLESNDWSKRGFALEAWTKVPIDPILDPNEDHVRFEFRGITQHLGEKVRYRYILEGLDKAYSEVTSENYRVYSPLPPGEYTFKVVACNADGVWSPEPASLHFTIRTPFWQTAWFALLAIAALIVLLLGIIRFRTSNLQKQRSILERKVKLRTEALENANQVKGEFLAKMSHEIRTPMNGVIGMTDLLERTPLTPQQRKFVQNIRVSGQNLLNLINDILDFSRIESGKMELEYIAFDLRHTMEEVVDMLSFSAFAKDLELLYWVDPEIRGPVMGDPARIKQILTNLVGNAIKFTSQGEISVRAELVQLEGDVAIIRCSVKDSGIGIPKEKHSNLFDSFTQVDASTTRKYGGTGLGLAISYNLSVLMGGEMWVESELGKGSEFFFTIQVGTSGPWNFPGDAHPAKALEGQQIVVAMKNEATIALIREYLKHWGVEMQVYGHIENAIDAAIDSKSVNFLLVDLRLGHGDPNILAQKIAGICNERSLKFGIMAEPDVSIPMMSSIGEMGWVISKPLKRDDLLHALLGLRPDTNVQATQESHSTLALQVPLRILIAEDNPINQDVAMGMLNSLGYQATIANNGLEAYEEVCKGQIDLVFMDVQMPVMDGIAATQRIVAEIPKAQRPIIVAMTANAMESDRQRCLEAGMDTFISKPFLMNELVRTIRTVPAMRSAKLPDGMRNLQVEESVAIEAFVEEPSPDLEEALESIAPAQHPLTDMTMLEGVSNGDDTFIIGILTKLIAKLPEAVEELKLAADQADWETVRATSHRNKSSAAYSGCEELKNKFMELEHLARDRKDLDQIPARLDVLEAFVAAVVAELKVHLAERSK